MITRLEIDGFKSFAGFAVDLPPFVAVVGPNASGKSNIFDALAFLSRAVTMPIAEALGQGRGEPVEQFRRTGDGTRVDVMSFAVEVLVGRRVVDDFGTSEVLPHTRLRYELEIELRPDERSVVRPFVVREAVRPISKGQDRWARGVSEDFAATRLRYEASQWKILATEEDAGQPVFSLKGRRGANPQGRNTRIPARRAVSSVLTSVTTALEFPLLFAVRQEVESWRVLQLEPAALRLPAPVGLAQDRLGATGGNLPWVLELLRRTSEEDGTAGLPALAGDLARVIRGFSGVEVVANDARGQWELSFLTRDEGRVSARVASDGTLRLLALLTALYESDGPRVLCFEEPENGINPRRLTAMLDVLRDLVTDPAAPIDPEQATANKGSGDETAEDPLVQLILSSHSPLLPLRLRPAELLVVDSVTLVEEDGRSGRITRARRIATDDQQLEFGGGTWAPLPAGAQYVLPGITRQDARDLMDAL